MSDDYVTRECRHRPTLADIDRWAGHLVVDGSTATCEVCGKPIVRRNFDWVEWREDPWVNWQTAQYQGALSAPDYGAWARPAPRARRGWWARITGRE